MTLTFPMFAEVLFGLGWVVLAVALGVGVVRMVRRSSTGKRGGKR